MQKILLKNFKEMPSLLRIFFIVETMTIISGLIALITQQPVDFTYFGSQFPKNMPAVWQLFNVFIALFGLYVTLKRSYSLLLKYMIIRGSILIVAALNSVYLLAQVTKQTEVVGNSIAYVLILGISVAIIFYYLTQKKYFNKP
ncbi:hypothetical protein KA078_03035 [Candidatus Woesebacteria bacterium]|nr:hypothetical protein [Candidatus Woesebacteria bacterium]